MRAKTTAIRLFERRLFTTLIVGLFVLGGLYSYFLVSSIVNVIVREDVEEEIATLNSKLSDLEFTYIKRQEDIDMRLARNLGFNEIEEKQFVTRREALTLSDGGR